MRTFLLLAAMVFLSGCFTSGRQSAKAWTVEPPSVRSQAVSPEGGSPAFATTRVGSVVVSAPYDRPSFVVRRSDGSVAFDAYNEFAAAPSSILRTPVRTQLANDGRFGHVVPSSSVAGADASVEVLVHDLSLDCRESGKRVARAAVSVDVVNTGRGPRSVVLSGDGTSEADAAAGDYSAAFSEAFNAAFSEALRLLK